MADGVLHERLRLAGTVDEDDQLGSGNTVGGAAVASEREVALDARPTERGERVRDALRPRRIGLVTVGLESEYAPVLVRSNRTGKRTER